ncbi:MAG: acetolactate synthase small subunit [archaeon]
MYSDRIVKTRPKDHTLAILVYDEPGVFMRISNLFLKRNFNITTLTVSPSATAGLSRFTITFRGDDNTYEQMVKQLNKLVDVIKTSDMESKSSIVRDLCLIKVKTKDLHAQNQVMNYCQSYHGKVVDITQEEVVVELVGKPDKIDAFLELVRPLGIKEIARTGVTALTRGNKSVEDQKSK